MLNPTVFQKSLPRDPALPQHRTFRAKIKTADGTREYSVLAGNQQKAIEIAQELFNATIDEESLRAGFVIAVRPE